MVAQFPPPPRLPTPETTWFPKRSKTSDHAELSRKATSPNKSHPLQPDVSKLSWVFEMVEVVSVFGWLGFFWMVFWVELFGWFFGEIFFSTWWLRWLNQPMLKKCPQRQMLDPSSQRFWATTEFFEVQIFLNSFRFWGMKLDEGGGFLKKCKKNAHVYPSRKLRVPKIVHFQIEKILNIINLQWCRLVGVLMLVPNIVGCYTNVSDQLGKLDFVPFFPKQV